MELIRPNVTAESLFERVVARAKEKLHKATPNSEWTNMLKSTFAELAKEVDANYVLSSSQHGGELLFDMAWRQSESCPDIILSMESEWGDEGDVLNDFKKLMNVKAGLKVMIFSTKKDAPARSTMEAAIAKCLSSSVHHMKGEEYLLFNFPHGLPGMAYCSGYTFPRDGEQTEIKFEEKRQTKLWD